MLSFRYLATALVFLGVLPVAVYLGGSTYLALSLGCIVLIAATIYIAFAPADGAHAASVDAR